MLAYALMWMDYKKLNSAYSVWLQLPQLMAFNILNWFFLDSKGYCIQFIEFLQLVLISYGLGCGLVLLKSRRRQALLDKPRGTSTDAST